MVKGDFLRKPALQLLVLMVLFLSGCSERQEYPVIVPDGQQLSFLGTITAAGGILTGLEGSVSLTFPENAVKEPISLWVSEFNPYALGTGGNEPEVPGPIVEGVQAFTPAVNELYKGAMTCTDGFSLALKAIMIEPYVLFAGPVMLTMKYNECLCNGTYMYEGMSLSALTWSSGNCYMNGDAPASSTVCTLNTAAGTVCMCIRETGIIAVKLGDSGE